MTATHKIINKETGFVIEGEPRPAGTGIFHFHIAGCSHPNSFFSSDWDIEEIEPPYTLPTEYGLYGVDNSTGDPFGRWVFKRSWYGWLELTRPDLTPREVEEFLLVSKWPLRRLVFAALEAALGQTATDTSRVLAILDAVIDAHKGEVGTHYDGCYKFHAGCLAVRVRHALGQAARIEQNSEGNEA